MKKSTITLFTRTDSILLMSVGLAAIYWIIESILYFFQTPESGVFNILFGPEVNNDFSRLITLCLFVIFTSHVSYTISQRKKTQKVLQASEERYRTIIESMEEGYYEMDPAGSFTFINDAFAKILRCSKEEILGGNFRHFFNGRTAELFQDEFNLVYETGKFSRKYDIELHRYNGEPCMVEISISTIKNMQGKPTGFRGIMYDVTELRRAEDLVRQKKAAEEANRAKSEFLANMSHEIRTPLNGIIGMTELAMDTKLDDNQANILTTISSEANALLEIINDILDFSKIEAGMLELEEIPFDLSIVVDNVANSIAHSAQKKGLEFITFLSPDIQQRLVGDPVRVRQILINLLGNAVKFTHEGEIYLKIESRGETENTLNVRFSVKDTGVGIPENIQSKIFDSFTQADGSTTRKYGGTGLGTAISKQLVELMGGEIGLESEVGKGSTFWFLVEFPKQTGPKTLMANGEVDLTDKKVLVVDDNANNRYILMEYLISWGCRPFEAKGGDDAIRIINETLNRSETFDLILTDFQMPDMSGFELAEKVRADRSLLKNVPIILLTSAGRLGDGQRCKDIGIEGYLNKPVRRNELHKAIISVLSLSAENLVEASKLVTRHSIAEDFGKEIHILLVEDYPTNQQVALKHLRSEGYTVDLAENGKQAVEAFRLKPYDIILMDIQMPIMDGFEATREIRRIEKIHRNRQGRKAEAGRTPVIAMTAHAFKGDREKTAEEGMDDYIAKPLRKKELLNIVGKWAGKKEAPGRIKVDDLETIKSNEAPMDYSMALSEFDQDKDFLDEVLQGFIEIVEKQITEIKNAISIGDAETVKKEAHSIKGGAANLTADSLYSSALELEKIGKSGELGDAGDALEKLSREFRRLKDFSRTFVSE